MIDFSSAFSTIDPLLQQPVLRLAKRIVDDSGRAFLVGGIVRDLLLTHPITDADMEIYGIPTDRLRALLEELFPGRVHDVGRAFSVFKVTLDGGHELDVALPRRDSKTGSGHKGFEVAGDPSMTVEDATRRRDFTVNALLADPLTGEIIDPFSGKADLEARVLRCVDPATFSDDPLRVYRALQFSARFNLVPERRTFDVLKTMTTRGDLSELPKERITEEIRKLLVKAERPSNGLRLAWDLGIIERDYPELHALKATPQEPEWHPEGDVWIHTLMVVDQAARIIRRADQHFSEEEKLQIVLGAMCHDLGKPSTTGELEGRIRSRGHEEAGAEPTRSLLNRWTFGADAEHAALMVAMEHLKPGQLFISLGKGVLNHDQYVNAVRRLIKRVYPLPWQVLLASSEADFRGRGPDAPSFDGFSPSEAPYNAGDIFRQTVAEHHLDEAPTKPLVNGEDLIALGVEPGPEMGRIIREIEDARDRGEVKTREEALKLAQRLTG